MHDLERFNFVAETPTLKKGGQYEIVSTLRVNKLGRFEMSVFSGKHRQRLASTTKETAMTTAKYASEVGVDFISFGVPAFWDKDAELAQRITDERFQAVIKANPNAKIIVRLGLEPPKWWLESHKDDLLCSPDGTPIERIYVKFPSPSSEAYRRDAMEAMKKFINYVESKYPDNIAGYHPSGGGTSEWYYGDVYSAGYHGYDKATQKAWRKWLAKKYVTDEALQKAWNRPLAKISEAVAPTLPERFIGESSILDPKTHANVVDFNLFLQNEMCDMILLAAKTIRETAPRKRLSVVFYGYSITFSKTPNGPAYSGHYAFEKALKSPDIDIFTAPLDYFERLYGGVKCTQAPTQVALLRGKLWLDEDDNRTWLAPKSGSPPYVLDRSQVGRKETAMVMRRNLAQECVKNLTSWWMDLFGCGWFLDRELWNVMKEFEAVEKALRDNPVQFQPDVALLLGEKSMCHVAGCSDMTPFGKRRIPMTSGETVQNLQIHMGKAGTPFAYYMLSDLFEGRINPQLCYTSGLYALTKAERKRLREMSDKIAFVYLWCPGIVDIDKREISLDAMEELSGFKIENSNANYASAYPTELGKKEGLGEFGFKSKVVPLYSPVLEKGDKVLATYHNGKPAMVLRMSGKRPKFFIGVTKLSPEVCAYIAKTCGVHQYVDNNAVALANGRYLSVNPTKDGLHTVSLKEEAEVFDLLENKPLGRFKSKTFDLKKGDVKFFRLSK